VQHLSINKYLKPYALTVTLGALFLTAANFFLVWIPVLIRQTMDKVQELSDTQTQSLSLVDTLFNSAQGSILAFNALYLIAAVSGYGFFLFLTRQTLIVASRKVEFDLRNDVLDALFHLPARFYARFTEGEVYVRATEDIAKVREYFGPVIMYSINTITRAGFVISMMFIVNKELMVWALLPLPLLSIFAYWITGYIHKHSIIIQEQYSRLADQAKETFSSIRLVKAYNKGEEEQLKFDALNQEYKEKKLRLDLIESLFHPGLNFLIGISLIIVIWKGGLMVMAGELTIGNIAEFLIYVAYLIWPVAALGYTTNRFQKSMASWHRIKELFIEFHSKEHDESRELPITNGELRLENISFSYPDSDIPIIKNVNMHFPAGKKVAIVGRTGSGKSTLMQLIPRLFEPDEGAIYLDNEPIRDYSIASLRKHLGVVPQDHFLFSETIQENIAFGKKGATEEDVYEAARQAEVLDNILDFDKKFQTILGEKGITLSGGQKQRTAIARALIKKPKILILDDALSAVDTKTEDAILKSLNSTGVETTVIMISHRISTIKDADYIYYLEDGTVKESGTHDELITLKGSYKSMYDKQLIEQGLQTI
jgi:ATP-binding cassette subfamily B protein